MTSMCNPRFVLAAAVSAALASASSQAADQSTLTPVVNAGQQTLQFDWPAIRVGTAEYEDGPTGVTVVHFPKRALGAVDVRGGGPGTVNTDYLRLGYDTPELDAVVFSGGSWYGLESITAVGTALKDDGVRSGDWTNLALSVGAIIYDLGDRRLNEIYPDKRLAQAALRADRPGVFPLGSHGAGRFAKTGGLFGCNAFSGQGAAFRQTGEVKIAAFVVVNALGVVTRRDGRVAACYGDTHWSKDLRATDLLATYPDSRKPGTTVPASNEGKRNTTVSLIVTNQKLNPAELQRLATHVHSSMSRAITPFATEFDGDVLYAVSTGELDTAKSPGLPNIDLDVEGAELMWDAILASVPAQPGFPHVPREVEPGASALEGYAGEYTFSQFARLRITTERNKLFAQATGARTVYGIGQSAPTELQALSPTDFTVAGRYPLVLHFEAPGSGAPGSGAPGSGAPGRLVINPGDWQQIATK